MLVWPPENKSGWNKLFSCDAFFPMVSKSTSSGAVKGQTATPGNSSPCVSDKNKPPWSMMARFFRNTRSHKLLWLYLLNWTPLSSVLVVILEISSLLIRSEGLQKSLMCVMRPLIDSCDWQLARLLLSPALELALSPTSAASVPPHLDSTRLNTEKERDRGGEVLKQRKQETGKKQRAVAGACCTPTAIVSLPV